MRNDKLIPGTILVIIGALFLLDNFHVINFHWFSIFHLWPIILVIAGVNLIFVNNHSATATIVKVGVLILGMGFLVVNGLSNGYNDNRWNFGFHRYGDHKWNYGVDNNNDSTDTDNNDDLDSSSIGKITGSGHYNESYKPSIKFATLNVSGGAATYHLKDITNELFEADTKGDNIGYQLKTTNDSTSETVNFDMGKNHHQGVNFNFGDNKANEAYLKLNTNPIWDINVEAGAAELRFDLSNFKVKNLKLKGGAASFDIKLGQPVGETNVDVSTGVSEVTLSIPQNAACHITISTGLSSKNFDGFDSKGDNQFETPNFDKFPNKMYIKLKGAISDFKVHKY